MKTSRVIGVVSARPDGGTSVTVGLAARLSPRHRTLLGDLNLERPEVSPLLDLNEAPDIQRLAYRCKLSPVTPTILEGYLQWRDGLAVLAGSWLTPGRGNSVTDGFVDSLVAAIEPAFDWAVLDLGRPQAQLPNSLTAGVLLWVVTPTPLGLAALDRAMTNLEDCGATWQQSAKVVLNRVTSGCWKGAPDFIEREYQVEVVGSIPAATDFWDAVERTHSLAPLCLPPPVRGRFRRGLDHRGRPVRQALDGVVNRLNRGGPRLEAHAC